MYSLDNIRGSRGLVVYSGPHGACVSCCLIEEHMTYTCFFELIAFCEQIYCSDCFKNIAVDGIVVGRVVSSYELYC